jgi:broad specificity phosphatase PhoE
MHRPLAYPIVFALLLLVLSPAPAAHARRPQGAPTVVILVRHGEKEKEPANDPPLSEAGRKTADRLAAIGEQAGVEVIFTSQARRTRDTAAPLAARRGLTPKVRNVTRETLDTHVKALGREILDSHKGKTVLVVGHSNTAPRIAAFLANKTIPDLDDANEFDAIFVVIIPETGTPTLIKAKY